MDYDHLGSFHRWVGWLVFCTSHRGSGLPDTVQQQPSCHWKHWNAKVASVDPGVSHGLECWIVFLLWVVRSGWGGWCGVRLGKGERHFSGIGFYHGIMEKTSSAVSCGVSEGFKRLERCIFWDQNAWKHSSRQKQMENMFHRLEKNTSK